MVHEFGGKLLAAKELPDEQIKQELAALFALHKRHVESHVDEPVLAHEFGNIFPEANELPEAQTKHFVASLLISQVKQLEWQVSTP